MSREFEISGEKKLQTSDLSMVPTKLVTVCTFKLKRKELAWSAAQTACINKACRRKCDVRVGFDRFVSGEILRVWCRFWYIVAFEGLSLGLQENVSSCLFLTHWSWDGVELEKWNNESVIKAATKDNNLSIENFSLQSTLFLHVTPLSNHTVRDYSIKSADSIPVTDMHC